MISAIVGLQLGPFSVVLETLFSGISSLPFSAFVLLMQPIHLAIGVVEGLATVAVISFVYKARPEILGSAFKAQPIGDHPVRNLVLVFLLAAFVTGGSVSWFASKNPDALEWAIARVTGKGELQDSKQGIHGILAAIQEVTAFMPDYSFKQKGEKKKPEESANHTETSVAGLVGGMITLVLAFLIGFALNKRIKVPPGATRISD
jgi:cobalt/nickel transport system permease protein